MILDHGKVTTQDFTIRATVPGSEWSKSFIEGMLNRMGMSFLKYGAVKKAYPAKVDALRSLEERLARYRETGNTEWLIDVANFAMIEYMAPGHPEAHYRATDAAESPGRRTQSGARTARSNSELR